MHLKKESFPHPQKYQNKSRFIQSSHYVVDYDAIFAESGGQLKDYWELPLEIDRSHKMAIVLAGERWFLFRTIFISF